MLIQNLNYLKTAIEVLESGNATEVNTIKILKTMSEICAMNAKQLMQNSVQETANA